MKIWICLLSVTAIVIIFALLIKIYLLKKSAKEIYLSVSKKINEETNTLIDISSHDKNMCLLANELNQQLEQLYRQRQRFYQGDMELKEAVTNISHDIRTPLTSICAYIDLLKGEEKSKAVNNYLKKIENRTMVLKQLTEELFKYSVVTCDTEHISCEPIVVNSVLEESISSFYAVIKKSMISPYIEIPEKKVVRNLDINALSRIFENIISNAIKYSDGDLKIVLKDNGIITFSNHSAGLTETQVAKLFDRFYTVNTARQSTGLGLSIAKTLVEQMNGLISAEYEKNVVTICVDFSDHYNSK